MSIETAVTATSRTSEPPADVCTQTVFSKNTLRRAIGLRIAERVVRKVFRADFKPGRAWTGERDDCVRPRSRSSRGGCANAQDCRVGT
jgi:hypothetical protein